MDKRLALVNKVNVISVKFSSIMGVGDVKEATPESYGLAVQKPTANFDSKKEVSLKNDPILKRKPIWITDPCPVKQETRHENGTICVDNVFIIGVSQSSLFQIGSLETVRADARIKHIRQLGKRRV